MQRVMFLGAPFSVADFLTVLDLLRSCRAGVPFRYVVTPNVDHLVRLSRKPQLQSLYDRAWLSLCDGRIVRALGRLLGRRLDLVSGSDLVAAMVDRVIERDDRICIVGGAPAMVAALGLKRPDIVIDHISPPMGLAHDEGARTAIVSQVAGLRYRYIFLAVGSPQQEKIAAAMADAGTVTGTALCIGGGLDYITSQKRRAPLIVQRVGLEFLWRIAEDPRRLWRRYLLDGPTIFALAFRSLLTDGPAGGSRSTISDRD